ncbi:MAG: hypothetical protein V9G98_03095 [Candidatus Competibacter sp.]
MQTQRFQVDYLDRKAAERLITEPVKLRYPPAVRERLFDLTQGHPALLQLLCKTLVDIANRNQKADMSMADLDLALQEAIGRETYPMLVFWKQFCATPALPADRGAYPARRTACRRRQPDATGRTRFHRRAG